jgi:uncharacterized membrane protein YphA (DoxX/SURF4 family)
VFLDLLFGPFVLLGIERASVTPGAAPGFSLDYIDWSHSLVMSLAWSVLFGVLFWRHGSTVMMTMGVAVLSHFLMDLTMHPPDLALWPNSDVHVGLGLWRALPIGWWFAELAVILVLCAYYVSRARRSDLFGGRPLAVAFVVILLHICNSPWLSPL